jgi:hypothetical protein
MMNCSTIVDHRILFFSQPTYLVCGQNNQPSVSMKKIDESLKAKSAAAERESIDAIVSIDSVDSDFMGVFVNGIYKRCYSNFP